MNLFKLKTIVYLTRCLLIVIVLAPTSFISADDYKAWRVSSIDDSHLEFSMVIDDSVKDVELSLASESRDNNSKNNRVIIEALSEYFVAAKSNNIQKIKSLYFIDDGSRERFQKEIKENPKKFSKFNLIKKVSISEIVKWSGYRAVNVRIYGDNGLLTPFTELLYCGRDYCKLSNRIFSQNESFSFFTTLMGLVSKSKEIKYQGDGQFPVFPDFSDNQFPIHINFKLNQFPSKIEIDKLSDPKVSSANTPDEVNSVVDFVSSVWALDSNNNNILDNDEISSTGDSGFSNEKINKVFISSWDGSYSQELIPNYTLEKKKEASDSKENTVTLGAAYYTDLAFSQHVAKWKRFEFEGFFQTDKTMYVWVKYELGDEDFGLFLFSVNKKNKKLTSKSGMLGSLMTNRLFIDIVRNSLSKHAVQSKGAQ